MVTKSDINSLIKFYVHSFLSEPFNSPNQASSSLIYQCILLLSINVIPGFNNSDFFKKKHNLSGLTFKILSYLASGISYILTGICETNPQSIWYNLENGLQYALILNLRFKLFSHLLTTDNHESLTIYVYIRFLTYIVVTDCLEAYNKTPFFVHPPEHCYHWL